MAFYLFFFFKREQTKSLAVFQVGIDGNTGSRGQIAKRHLGGAEVENVAVAVTVECPGGCSGGSSGEGGS